MNTFSILKLKNINFNITMKINYELNQIIVLMMYTCNQFYYEIIYLCNKLIM